MINTNNILYTELNFPKDTLFLVTGGAGFIGSNLCEAVLKMGYSVRCLDDLSTKPSGAIRQNWLFTSVLKYFKNLFAAIAAEQTDYENMLPMTLGVCKAA